MGDVGLRWGECQSGPVFEIVWTVGLTDFVLSLYRYFFVFYLGIVGVLYLCISCLFFCINISQFVYRPSSSMLKAWWATWKLNYEFEWTKIRFIVINFPFPSIHPSLANHLTGQPPSFRHTTSNIKNKLLTHLPIHPIKSHVSQSIKRIEVYTHTRHYRVPR